MKLGIGIMGAWALGASVLFACSGTAQQNGTASTDLATMVAALSVNSDGSDTTWSEATDPEPVAVPGCGFENIVSKVIAHYDTNGDGSLSADERSSLDGSFGDHDGDDQGAADAGPSAAKGHPGGHGRVAMLIKLYDTNNDGTLDATEIAALQADIDARCQARLAKLVAQFDTNGDGQLDATEWAAAKAALHARFQDHEKGEVAKFDTNGDGKISADEAKAAHAAEEQERDDAEKQFSSSGDGKLNDGDEQRFRDHGRECVRDDKEMMSGSSEDGDSGGRGGSGGTSGGVGTAGASGDHVPVIVHVGVDAGSGGSSGGSEPSND